MRVAIFRSTCLATLILLGCLTISAFSQNASGFKFIEVKLVDTNGQPLAEVPVNIRVDGTEFPMPTDEQGVVAFNVPSGEETHLTLQVKHLGYAATGASWAKGDTIPESFTIPLKRGATIGGIAQDQQGQPIEGVEVEGTLYSETDSSKGELRPTISGVIAKSDSAGKWTFTSAPNEAVNLHLQFSHPDYVSKDSSTPHVWSWQQLLDQDQVIELRRGFRLRGRVLDPQSQPVPGAEVTLGEDGIMSSNPKAKTDAEGKFAFEKLPDRLAVLTVLAKGWAPELHTLYPTEETTAEPIDIRLLPPSVVRIRTVNPEGEPIPGVRFGPEYWRGHRSLYTKLSGRTDEHGIWEWSGAPADAVRYQIGALGYFAVRGSRAEFTAADEVQDLVLLPAANVVGTVIDKETRKPIKEFTYVQGLWWDDDSVRPILQRSSQRNLAPGQDGKFAFTMHSGCAKYLWYVEAEGYRPSRSRAILPEEGDVELTFEMEPCESIRGTVKLPGGEPVDGVRVIVATPLESLHFYNGNINTGEARTTTDQVGQFTLPAADEGFVAVFLHDRGVAQLTEKQLTESTDVLLQPWACVEGTIAPSLRRLTAGMATLSDFEQAIENQNGLQEYRAGKKAYVTWYYRAEPDTAGAFAFQRVPPWPMVVGGSIPIGPPERQGYYPTHTQVLELVDGESTTVTLGGQGAMFKGQAALPDKYDGESIWQQGAVKLKQSIVRKSAASHRLYRPEYTAAFDSEGHFEFVDLPPGRYDLAAELYNVESGTDGWKLLASAEQTVTVPAGIDGDKPAAIDFGKLRLQLADEQ